LALVGVCRVEPDPCWRVIARGATRSRTKAL
jgi:hypothetical protein